MTNRRTKKQQGRFRRAPSDVQEGFEEGLRPIETRSIWQWTLLGLKVGVGVSLLVGAVVALAFGVHHYARTTPRFSISRIEVVGTKRLVRDDVLRAAGFDKGLNLFALDVESTERSLLQSPWISEVKITRKLPNTVILEITERESVAVAVIDHKSFLVSRDGKPFKRLGRGDPHDLPLITGVSKEALAADRRAEQERLVDALSLLRDYDRLSLSQQWPVQELHLEPSGAIVLSVGQEGTSLALGLPPWKKKLLRAERVMNKARRSGGHPGVIFLDNEAHPERVVVRVR